MVFGQYYRHLIAPRRAKQINQLKQYYQQNRLSDPLNIHHSVQTDKKPLLQHYKPLFRTASILISASTTARNTKEDNTQRRQKTSSKWRLQKAKVETPPLVLLLLALGPDFAFVEPFWG